jgi:hypothetical protein
MPENDEQESSEPSSAAPQAYLETRWTVWAKSLGVVLIGIASLALGLIGLRIQQSVADVQRSVAENQKRNSIDDLALRQRTFDHQMKTDDARLAASLIPFMKCTDDLQRAAALDLIARSAPAHGQHFSELILKNCPALPKTVRVEVSRVQEQSRIQQQSNEFFLRLGNARDYKNFGHDGPAARLFEEASKLMPTSIAAKVRKDELEKAKRAFDDGRFAEAADLYQQAFRAVPNLP